MAPSNPKESEDGSDSEVEKSSNSSSESSGSASESDSEAESVHSKQSSGSGSSVKSNNSQGKHSDKNDRSSSADDHSSSDNDEDGEGKLVLDEQKSRSPSSSSSSPKSESSNKDGEVDENQLSPLNKKRKHAVLSDEDSQEKSDDDDNNQDEEGKANTTAEALFGEAGDISSENEEGGTDDEAKQVQSAKHESEEEEEGKGSDQDVGEKRENERDKEPEEQIPETKIEHEIPYIRADVGKEFHFVKLPNFLSVEPRPYDPETYEDEIDEEETLDEEGRARLKLKVENTIRWRTNFDKEGNAIKESNARMVRWSDGSLSLLLGSEVFDVYRQPLQGDHNHLFIRQGTGLQGQAVFRTKLTFRPHSTDSFTHRKMTLSLADRSQKTSAIKILGTVGKDPEAHRGEMIKKEEDRLRASMRRDSKQKRIRERTAIGRGLNSSYLEPDRGGYDDSEEEGAISLSAIKNKYKRGGDLRPSIYSSEEDASDIEGRKAKKLERAKALRDSDEEDGGTSGGATRTRTVSDSEDNSD